MKIGKLVGWPSTVHVAVFGSKKTGFARAGEELIVEPAASGEPLTRSQAS